MRYFGFVISPVSTFTEYEKKFLDAEGTGKFDLYASAEAAPVMTEHFARLIKQLEVGEPPVDHAMNTVTSSME